MFASFLGLSGINLAMAIVVFGILIAMAIAHTLQNSVDVKAGVEWAVIADINGNLDALGYGTHSIPPGWKEVDRIPTNVQELSEKGEEVGTAGDNVSVALDEFVTYCAGHKLEDRGDGWFVFKDPDDVDDDVDKETVILASTKIDPGKITELTSIEKMIKEVVDSSFEDVFRLYTPDQLVALATITKDADRPDTDRPLVPNVVMPELLNCERMSDSKELRRRLAIMVKNIANQQLWKYGLGVIDIKITNLRYFNPKLQAAAESGQEKILIARNIKKVLDELPDAEKITQREALLLGNPTFSDVAVAQLKKESAKILADGGITAAASIVEAVKNIVIKHT